MCYDIKVLYETALKRARRKHDSDVMKAIEKELKFFKDAEYYHVSGYSHPKIPIYTSENPYHPKLQTWGLIPSWVKDEPSANTIRKKILNARAESLFEKPSFRESAKNKRCLVYVDGFFEHHHFRGNVYPYFIHNENESRMCIAGIWDEWINKKSGEIYRGFSLVTISGKGIMKHIHNNPKLPEARMPLILDTFEEENWLNNIKDNNKLKDFIHSQRNNNLKAHTVLPLRGKNSTGNLPATTNDFHYPELSTDFKFEF